MPSFLKAPLAAALAAAVLATSAFAYGEGKQKAGGSISTLCQRCKHRQGLGLIIGQPQGQCLFKRRIGAAGQPGQRRPRHQRKGQRRHEMGMTVSRNDLRGQWLRL